MKEITVGLDFGTHQTKICVESIDGAELEYSFFKFQDTHGKLQFTVPSIIKINPDETLEYGYVSSTHGSRIIKYFKQATFTNANTELTKDEAKLYSIWYLSFILFNLEEKYDTNFSIQMGVPSDGTHLQSQKQLAVSILLSAYNLVEDVFKNDKDAFFSSSITELKKKTKIIPFSESKKKEYLIKVFPEAYACLMPLISSSKIAKGMSIMVDIGGGTTDISFFSYGEDVKDPKKQCKLRVYDFKSINKGLNYLTNTTDFSDRMSSDSNVKESTELIYSYIRSFKFHMNEVFTSLRIRLYNEFRMQGNLPKSSFEKAVNGRPIIYTGGGSRFSDLRVGYGGFEDIIHISHKNWKSSAIHDLDTIIAKGLCPILSTSYGLSIHKKNDNIHCEPFRDIFSGIRTMNSDYDLYSQKKEYVYGKAIGGSDGFDYMDDYNACK